MTSRVIGLSGIAGAGKDLFYQLLVDNAPFSIKRFALADDLKVEVRDICKQLYGVDILTCSREEKDSIRPFLVAHGKIRRARSGGRHWIDLTDAKINQFLKENPNSVVCVTDIRYDVFERDEVNWLQNEMNGVLVHIAKYTLDPDTNLIDRKVFGMPPNQEEAENDPKLKIKADYQIEWPQIFNEQNQTNTTELGTYAKDFLKFFTR